MDPPQGGAPTPQFVELVRRLLESPRRTGVAARPAIQPRTSELRRSTGPATRAGLAALAVLCVAAGLYVALRPRRAEPAPQAAPSPARPAEAAPAPVAPDEKSVAVLPFANMSADKDNEFFADGVHEDVITNLAKIRELKVISRTSVLAYRDPASRNLKKIAAELGVATVLEGSVRRAGNTVRVTAQLIDASTDQHLWAEAYDRDVSDIFAVQAEIAQEIASALKANLTTSERVLIAARPTQNQEAYDLYLRARETDINTGLPTTKANMDRVIGLYEAAVAKDPSFALAYVQLAVADTYEYWFGYLDPSQERLERAKAAVDAAVRLAPDLPETHLALGLYYYRGPRDWAHALTEFLAAERGLPNDAELVYLIGLTCRRIGQGKEALGYLERSVVLNPKGSAAVSMSIHTLRYLRHYPEIVEMAKRYPQAMVGFSSNFWYVSGAQFEIDGDREAYVRRLESDPAEAIDDTDPLGLARQFRVLLARGDLAGADRVLSDPRLKGILGDENVLIMPVALPRALVAFLEGDREAAVARGEAAIAALRATKTTQRQGPFLLMYTAEAEAYAGRRAEAVRDGEAALADALAHDAVDSMVLRENLGRVYVAAGERERALSLLRTMMEGPCLATPGEIRMDPLWSRLKDDPRFEQLLGAARPL